MYLGSLNSSMLNWYLREGTQQITKCLVVCPSISASLSPSLFRCNNDPPFCWICAFSRYPFLPAFVSAVTHETRIPSTTLIERSWAMGIPSFVFARKSEFVDDASKFFCT